MTTNKRQFKLESLETRELLSFVANPGSPNVSLDKNAVAFYSATIIGNGNPSETSPPSVSNQAHEGPGARADNVQALLA